MGVWVEPKEPSWVRLIIDRASFRSPTQCAARGEGRRGEIVLLGHQKKERKTL